MFTCSHTNIGHTTHGGTLARRACIV
jgi:hypothetical protein